MDKKGFGSGFVAKRFDLVDNIWTRWNPVVEEKEIQLLSIEEGNLNVVSTKPEKYIEKLMMTAKKVADSMSSLITLIMDAPLNLRYDEGFNNVVQSIGALIRVKGPTQSSTNDDAKICTQKLVANHQGTMQLRSSVVRMMEVFEEKQRLEERLGEPSFSLGFTYDPLFNDVVYTTTDKVYRNFLLFKMYFLFNCIAFYNFLCFYILQETEPLKEACDGEPIVDEDVTHKTRDHEV